MQLSFLGGADEVGASGTLIEIAGKKILVDAGIRISAKRRFNVGDDQLPDLRLISEVGGPDAIFVTHAHTDHTGALPLVMERYPYVPVFATAPTIALTRVLQADAQRIMKSRQEQENELPLFDEVAVDRLMSAFQETAPRHPLRLGEGVQATFHISGHIVGACSIVFESEEGTLVMSGDVSLAPQRTVSRASMPNLRADALVLESTYGGKLHANRAAEEKRLIETLADVVERGGKALIPAFALGRAQEVLQILLAHQNALDVPIYADGMVRAVCRAYSQFADWLPQETTRRAGDKALFFRGRVRPVESLAQRMEIAQGEGAAIIVSSSGMLMGGPSALYAKLLAADSRNAILLTGYQDEESPGRILQRAIKERAESDEVTIQIDGAPVTVRCELGTYSLSAHADEGELIAFAEALDPSEIALVHGDPSARGSVANALRARGRIVRLPQSGSTLAFAFERRPWAVGKAARVKHAARRAVDPAALWQALHEQGRDGDTFTARELALMWGDESLAEALIRQLAPGTEGGAYFAADWRQRDHFRVRTAEQAAAARKALAILRAYPDLVGKLIVLRDSSARPRIGVVMDAGAGAFDAYVYGAKGRHYSADALLWVVGAWQGIFPSKSADGAALGALNKQLGEAYKLAKTHGDALLPYEKRAALAANGAAVDPASLLPPKLPDGMTEQTALLAVTLRLAADGAVLDLERGGLVIARAQPSGMMEQNAARLYVLENFPAEARMRKVGIEANRKRLLLTFDFPDVAASRFAAAVEQMEEQTGWEIAINPTTNQQALGTLVFELLPPHAALERAPSFFLNTREVTAQVRGLNADEQAALEAAFHEQTGFWLRLRRQEGQNGDSIPFSAAAPPPTSEQMEINAAYARVKAALDPFGLMKVGLKQGQLVLTFITPQVGARCGEIIARLAEETGYPISIHPHPDQNAIMALVQRQARAAGWQIRKTGLHTDRAEIALSLTAPPDDADLERVQAAVMDATGYTLVAR